jgi:type II secretory pathway pseudopilin PulG
MMFSHRPRSVRPAHDERGETLIELMATVVLMGVSIVAIVGALMGVIQTSSQHRRATRAGNEAVNVVEFIRDQDYTPCVTTSTYALPTPPPRYSYTISSVRSLQSNTAGTPVWIATPGGCNATNDQGAQQITVKVTATGTGAVSRSLTFVKRKKICPGANPADPENC